MDIDCWLKSKPKKDTLGFPATLENVPKNFNANPSELKHLMRLIRKSNFRGFKLVRYYEKTTKTRIGEVKKGYQYRLILY